MCFAITVYYSFIQPTIDYTISIWGSTSVTNINKVQRLQNYSARIIRNNFDYYNSRGIDLVKQLGWMNVSQRFLYFEILLMFKCINGFAPTFLTNCVTLVNEVCHTTTRQHSMNLFVPFPKTESYKLLLFYRGARSWNALPGFIKDCNSIIAFKTLLKGYILDKA